MPLHSEFALNRLCNLKLRNSTAKPSEIQALHLPFMSVHYGFFPANTTHYQNKGTTGQLKLPYGQKNELID